MYCCYLRDSWISKEVCDLDFSFQILFQLGFLNNFIGVRKYALKINAIKLN